MFCKSCGKEINESMKFCPTCGHPVEALHPSNITATSPIEEPVSPARVTPAMTTAPSEKAIVLYNDDMDTLHQLIQGIKDSGIYKAIASTVPVAVAEEAMASEKQSSTHYLVAGSDTEGRVILEGSLLEQPLPEGKATKLRWPLTISYQEGETLELLFHDGTVLSTTPRHFKSWLFAHEIPAETDRVYTYAEQAWQNLEDTEESALFGAHQPSDIKQVFLKTEMSSLRQGPITFVPEITPNTSNSILEQVAALQKAADIVLYYVPITVLMAAGRQWKLQGPFPNLQKNLAVLDLANMPLGTNISSRRAHLRSFCKDVVAINTLPETEDMDSQSPADVQRPIMKYVEEYGAGLFIHSRFERLLQSMGVWLLAISRELHQQQRTMDIVNLREQLVPIHLYCTEPARESDTTCRLLASVIETFEDHTMWLTMIPKDLQVLADKDPSLFPLQLMTDYLVAMERYKEISIYTKALLEHYQSILSNQQLAYYTGLLAIGEVQSASFKKADAYMQQAIALTEAPYMKEYLCRLRLTLAERVASQHPKVAARWLRELSEENLGTLQVLYASIVKQLCNAVSPNKYNEDIMALLQDAAEQGAGWANMKLGDLYTRGDMVPQDLDKVEEFYDKAAELGHEEGVLKMGLMYYYGSSGTTDFKKAEQYFLQAAKQGVTEAKEYLIRLYGYGLVPATPHVLLSWLENYEATQDRTVQCKAAHIRLRLFPKTYNYERVWHAIQNSILLGEEEAWALIPFLMERERHDAQKVAAIYLFVAQHREDGSLGNYLCYLSILCRRNQLGVAQYFNEEEFAYARSLIQVLLGTQVGLTQAILTMAMAVMEVEGLGGPVHPEAALAIMNEVAESNPHMQIVLGELFLWGDVVTRNLVNAEQLFLQAASMNLGRAAYRLAEFYRDFYTDTDRDELVISWLEKGVEFKDTDAMLMLGHLYQHSTSVANHMDKALGYYNAALYYGNVNALSYIESACAEGAKKGSYPAIQWSAPLKEMFEKIQEVFVAPFVVRRKAAPLKNTAPVIPESKEVTLVKTVEEKNEPPVGVATAPLEATPVKTSSAASSNNSEGGCGGCLVWLVIIGVGFAISKVLGGILLLIYVYLSFKD